MNSNPNGLVMAPTVGTAYNAAMKAKFTPFAAAKYGMGGFTPSTPATPPGGLSGFAPSANSISTPKLQPLQFSGND